VTTVSGASHPAATFTGIKPAAEALKRGACTATDLVNESHRAWLASPNCRRAFLSVDWDGAFLAASKWDGLRAKGHPVPAFAGIPISVKDLFDQKGIITRAGSKSIDAEPPATHNAKILAHLEGQGFITLGRTHMTEFAYSGLGLNSHHPDPHSIWDVDSDRVPGGSSSGAAVATALGAGFVGIGTDTGGSCRIPAAFNRLAGFKPTARRISRQGVLPLSPSLDSVGAVARSVQCLATVDHVMAGEREAAAVVGVLPPTVLVPSNFFFDDADTEVITVFSQFLDVLRANGVGVHDLEISEFDWASELSAGGGIVAAEAFSWHAHQRNFPRDGYDPRVAERIAKGEQISPDVLKSRKVLRSKFSDRISYHILEKGALLVPTVPILPPKKAACGDSACYTRLNGLILRNPSIANLIDGCSLTMPISRQTAPPVGAMLIGADMQDRVILSYGVALEELIANTMVN
jgi:aspartyl-tRNA(Asn)/glutamyl-tRNA(Gln) amidotransferase subunit A